MSHCPVDWNVTLTFVGRYKGIISVSLAVVEALGMPFAFPPNGFPPRGESISIAVEAIVSDCVLRGIGMTFEIAWLVQETMLIELRNPTRLIVKIAP